MAYYLVRFYSGSGDRPPEQLIREVVDHNYAQNCKRAAV